MNAAAMPPAPKIAAGAEVAALETIASICAVEAASTSTAAGADGRVGDRGERLGRLLAAERVEISGSPRSASIAAKRRLVGFQPIVLNASTMPTASVPVVAASVCAVIGEALAAVTVTSP